MIPNSFFFFLVQSNKFAAAYRHWCSELIYRTDICTHFVRWTTSYTDPKWAMFSLSERTAYQLSGSLYISRWNRWNFSSWVGYTTPQQLCHYFELWCLIPLPLTTQWMENVGRVLKTLGLNTLQSSFNDLMSQDIRLGEILWLKVEIVVFWSYEIRVWQLIVFLHVVKITQR